MMKNKKVTLETVDGFSIAGVHTISDGKSVILWLHGITVNKDEYLNLFKDGAEFLGLSGVDSLRIDFRGHGKSSGKSTDFSISGQMIDIDSVLQYLRDYYKTENLNLHLVGCSFGSPPAIFTGLKHSEIVKSITLIAPVLSYERTFLNPETQWARSLFNPMTIAKLYKTNKLYLDNFSISMLLYKEMQLIQPEMLIGRLSQKITIIHGDSDSMVPYEVSRDLANKFQNIDLITISEMDHGFNDVHDDVGTSAKSKSNRALIYEIVKNATLNG